MDKEEDGISTMPISVQSRVCVVVRVPFLGDEPYRCLSQHDVSGCRKNILARGRNLRKRQDWTKGVSRGKMMSVHPQKSSSVPTLEHTSFVTTLYCLGVIHFEKFLC